MLPCRRLCDPTAPHALTQLLSRPVLPSRVSPHLCRGRCCCHAQPVHKHTQYNTHTPRAQSPLTSAAAAAAASSSSVGNFGGQPYVSSSRLSLSAHACRCRRGAGGGGEEDNGVGMCVIKLHMCGGHSSTQLHRPSTLCHLTHQCDKHTSKVTVTPNSCSPLRSR